MLRLYKYVYRGELQRYYNFYIVYILHKYIVKVIGLNHVICKI